MGKTRKLAVLASAAATIFALGGCGSGSGGSGTGSGYGNPPVTPAPTPTPTPAGPTAYAARTLDSNDPTLGGTQDANLSHGWGIAFLPGAEVWVANHASNTSTLYNGNGLIDPLVVRIPNNAANQPAGPTGIVANASTAFMVSKAGRTGVATFLFDSTGGTISGWAQGVDATNAITVFDGSAAGDVFTGLAIYTQGGANMLYAANAGKGEVDVFDGAFNKIAPVGGFTDPTLPAGYKPFGIQLVNGKVIVTYAHFTTGNPIEDHGAGLGIVDIFDITGRFMKRLVDVGGALNAPWGVALAPPSFGTFSNALLIGNFGDGKINAYDPNSGAFIGTISDASHNPIVIPGLWGIAFGNDVFNQPSTTLFYAAGPTRTQGAFGRIDVTSAGSSSPGSTPTGPYTGS